MNKEDSLSIEISAGKKNFTIVPENDTYILNEAGSIVAIIKKEKNQWKIIKGSYTPEDAEIIGKEIEKLNF